MELLTKCDDLLSELEGLNGELIHVDKQLDNKMLDFNERIAFYEQEFATVMKMAGCYDDLMKYLAALEESDKGMRFRVHSMKKKAVQLMTAEIINV